LIDKYLVEIARQHEMCVERGLSGSVTYSIVVRDGSFVSLRVSQSLVHGRKPACISDHRNRESFDAVSEWLNAASLKDGQLAVKCQYTDGIMPRSRLVVAVIQGL
jgi:hypothetical protein